MEGEIHAMVSLVASGCKPTGWRRLTVRSVVRVREVQILDLSII